MSGCYAELDTFVSAFIVRPLSEVVVAPISRRVGVGADTTKEMAKSPPRSADKPIADTPNSGDSVFPPDYCRPYTLWFHTLPSGDTAEALICPHGYRGKNGAEMVALEWASLRPAPNDRVPRRGANTDGT